MTFTDRNYPAQQHITVSFLTSPLRLTPSPVHSSVYQKLLREGTDDGSMGVISLLCPDGSVPAFGCSFGETACLQKRAPNAQKKDSTMSNEDTNAPTLSSKSQMAAPRWIYPTVLCSAVVSIFKPICQQGPFLEDKLVIFFCFQDSSL